MLHLHRVRKRRAYSPVPDASEEESHEDKKCRIQAMPNRRKGHLSGLSADHGLNKPKFNLIFKQYESLFEFFFGR